MSINKGRKPTFSEPQKIVESLLKIQLGGVETRHLTLKLVEKDLLSTKTIKSEGRGRPKVVYELTDNAVALINEHSRQQTVQE